jgi:hypothetical protein
VRFFFATRNYSAQIPKLKPKTETNRPPFLAACRSAGAKAPSSSLLDLVGLLRRDGGEEPPRRVQRAIGAITGESFLMRRLVSEIAQFAYEAAFCLPESTAKNIVPRFPH